ncbi:MAG: peptidoglycan-binding protein [Clostridia bacterium]|nr:peptidoglycan-binding protein [Clostridia bacterium]
MFAMRNIKERFLSTGKKLIAAVLIAANLLVYAPDMSFAQESVSPYKDLIIKMDDTGDDVILLQNRLRDLGYYPYKITGQFGSVTRTAVINFQKGNDLDADGIVGGKTAEILFENSAKRISQSSIRIPTPKPTPTPKPVTYGKLIEWSDVKKMISRGSKFKLRDFYTGIEYYVIMVGGSKHCDFEPATKNDTAKFKKTYGGKWSWDRRPVLARINGRWYAGSVNGMPHGYETISGNGMENQCCLHFLNSRTHGTNSICSKHQYCIKVAAGKK